MQNNIVAEGNKLVFLNMTDRFTGGNFGFELSKLLDNRQKNDAYPTIILDCSHVETAFPNALVPVAGLLDFYRQQGVVFQVEHLSPFLQKSRFFEPLVTSEHQRLLQQNALNVVWSYTTDTETNDLCTEMLRSISQEVVCEEGVITSMAWCMNEIMDNVLVHSGTGKGFVMGQVHKKTKHIAFSVYDYGEGIFNSLKNSVHAPKDALEAIQLAIQERVTRDKKIGQGNGMWGLSEIVANNAGRLHIISGSGLYIRRNGDVETLGNLPELSPQQGTCLVDFQLNYNKTVQLSTALKGHTPVNYRTEHFEDAHGVVTFRLADAKTGTGTRSSGQKIRNDLINMFAESKKGIVLDFDGLPVVSSSFADELVGKMVVHFGFLGFNQVVRLQNMNPTVQTVLERSIRQRMAEAFGGWGFPLTP